jgi:hypothetical protein
MMLWSLFVVTVYVKVILGPEQAFDSDSLIQRYFYRKVEVFTTVFSQRMLRIPDFVVGVFGVMASASLP